MPARHHVIAIIAFWLATTGWLFYQDLLPRLRSGGPPPFTIDLTDEASEQSIRWTLYKDGHDKGYARTWVIYHQPDDTFEIAGEYKLWSGKRTHPHPDEKIHSSNRVTREGELLEIRAEVFKAILGIEIEARIQGQIRDRQLVSHLHAVARGLPIESDPQIERTLPPVEVSHRGSVLNPLQPLNKIRGLRPGQRWRMPLFNPLQAAAARVVPGLNHTADGLSFLDAEVLPKVQSLPDIPLKPGLSLSSAQRGGAWCLVVQYTGEDLSGRTWVRESDGLVLRQEITEHGETIILNRD